MRLTTNCASSHKVNCLTIFYNPPQSMRSEMYTVTHTIGKTVRDIRLLQQLLRNLIKTSCTCGEEAEVRS